MASYKNDEQARLNRLASMTDNRPAAAQPASSRPNQFQGRTQLREACMIRLERIIPDQNQPRMEFDQDALMLLAASLRDRGQLQPIRVRWDDAKGSYVVVVGERRWRAAQLAGFESIACVVVAGDPLPEDLLEDQLVENALREDLKPIEQAKAYRTLMTSRGLTQTQLAERLQIRQGTVAKALALLALPETIQASVDAGEIGTETAYELSKVDDQAEQVELAREAAAGRINREALKERVRSPRKGRGTSKAKKVMTRSFRTSTGMRVTVEHKKGLDALSLAGALEEVLSTVRGEIGEGDQVAA